MIYTDKSGKNCHILFAGYVQSCHECPQYHYHICLLHDTGQGHRHRQAQTLNFDVADDAMVIMGKKRRQCKAISEITVGASS